MPHSRFGLEERSSAVFFDRDEPLRVIGGHAALLGDDPRHFKVFEVRGLGGVGKTRLLNELKRRAGEDRRARHVLWVSLEAEAAVTETGPLRAIREQLEFDCLLFDAALLTYWTATGQPFQVDTTSKIAQSFAFRSLDAGREIAGIPLPLGFAAEVFTRLSREVTRKRYYRQGEFERIDDLRLEPAALRERLPHWLGLDILRRLEAEEHALIALYDGYDRQAPNTIAQHAPWLRELIATLSRGLHVISTRERMCWNEQEWASVLQQVSVGALPDTEARKLIRLRLGDLDLAVEDRLIQASGRFPFFLEVAIGAYAARARGDVPIDVDELPHSHETAVAYLLEHLTPQQRTIALALASVQIFDEDLYRHLIRSLNVPISALEFEEFVARFYVEQLSPGLFKTHDVLTDAVRTSPSHAGTRRASLEAVTDHLLAACHGDGSGLASTVLPIFRGVIAGWHSVGEMPQRSTETLVDIGYQLYDSGYWHELRTIAPEGRPGGTHPVDVIAEFFMALAARRTVGVGHAIKLFDRLDSRIAALGRHQRSVEVEVAYLSELSGNYAKARQEFQQLERALVSFDPNDRTQLRIRLNHADVLTTDGALREASRLLLDAYEQLTPRVPLGWAELVRHRGHALRFCFLLDQAAELYARALAAAAEAPALVGKLQTNLAETLCWQDPTAALEAAALSTEISERLGNRIELLKCDAARGIALAKLGEFTAARDSVARAAALAREVEYPAGNAFARQAGAVIEGLAGDTPRLMARLAELDTSVASLGTYAHLRIAPAWLAPDRALFEQAADEVDWLEPAGLEARLRSILTL